MFIIVTSNRLAQIVIPGLKNILGIFVTTEFFRRK